MDYYVRHGEIQGRYLVFLKLTALYFTMSDIVHQLNKRLKNSKYGQRKVIFEKNVKSSKFKTSKIIENNQCLSVNLVIILHQ